MELFVYLVLYGKEEGIMGGGYYMDSFYLLLCLFLGFEFSKEVNYKIEVLRISFKKFSFKYKWVCFCGNEFSVFDKIIGVGIIKENCFGGFCVLLVLILNCFK